MSTRTLVSKLLAALAVVVLLSACSGAAIAPGTSSSATTSTTSAASPSQSSLSAKVNLNTATSEQILAAPNTGNRMVREFMEYRPYTSIAQFRKEIGKYVDAAQVAEYEKYFFVPVSPNNADAATLRQLSGVDAGIADKLVAARPYADKAAFLKKLEELTSSDQAKATSNYVEAQ